MKRGTGWIPDYPDLSDYTLEKDSEKLSKQVQSQGSNASIESLAQKICNALDILAKQTDESNKEELEKVKAGLETEVLGGIEFITADFHDVFQEGSVGSEVLLIKSHLKSIFQSLELPLGIIHLQHQYQHQEEKPHIEDITDMKLTNREISIVKNLLDVQLCYVNRSKNYSPEDSFGIDLDGRVCLRLLSTSLSSASYEVEEEPADLEIAKYWSILSRKQPKAFHNLIRNDERLLKKIAENPEAKSEIMTEQLIMRVKTSTQLFTRTHLIVRLYIFLQALVKLIKNGISFQEQFQSLSLEKMQEDLQRIRNLRNELTDTLKAIEYDKANLEKLELSFYAWDFQYEEEELEQEVEDLKIQFMTRFNRVNKFLGDLKEWLDQTQFKVETLCSQLEVSEITLERKEQFIKDFILEANSLSDSFSLNKLSPQPDHIIRKIVKDVSKARLPQIPPQFFKRIEIPIETPIDRRLAKFVRKELVDEVKLPESVKLSEIDKLIKPIVEVVAQILMPLGQYTNLSEAVSKSLKKVQSLVSRENDKHLENKRLNQAYKAIDQSSEGKGIASVKLKGDTEQSGNPLPGNIRDADNLTLQKMLQEVTGQHNSFSFKDAAPIDDKSLWLIISSALNEISQKRRKECSDVNYASFYPSIDLPLECSLIQLINYEIPENIERLLKRKQPLFQVRSTGEPSKNGKQIQFPISRELRADIRQSQAKLSSQTNISSDSESEVLNGGTSKKQQDVYLTLPEFVDLSYWFSPVEDQGNLNSCTAHAGIALIEYAQSKSSDAYIDASPLFLYKVTRNLMQQEGDSGASMRDTMKAMVAFGVCPEDHWRYDEAQFDQEPPPFCYSFAENYKALKYFRLDHGAISKSVLLAQVKVLLTSEIPCAFGFTLYDSAYEESNFNRGHIPLPTNPDKVIGGHTVVAVGYHDRKIIKNSDGDKFEGALLIRNSWGRGWGQGGYGWMPYEYVLKGLTADWWSLLKAEWLASGNFGAGASAWDSDQGGDGRKGRRQ